MQENENNQDSDNSQIEQKVSDKTSDPIESQPQISPNVSDSSPVPQKKVPKKMILIGFIFLIIVLIISGLYFYLQKQWSSPKTQESLQNTQKAPSPTPDPTANWKSYSNEKMGISFKYPTDYSVSKENGSITLNSPSYLCRHKLDPGGFVDPSSSPDFEPTSEVYMTIVSKEGKSYSEIWFDSFGFEFLKDELEEFIIDGKTSYYFSQGAEMSFSREAYLVEINNKEAMQIEVFLPIYQFECKNPTYEFSYDPKYQNTASQILSTFRFNSEQ